jgi:sialic acid synthase SpsE
MGAGGTITINGRRVGPGEPCYLIADIGSNHDGRLEEARRYIEAAAEIGLDAVKFQSFRVDLTWVPEVCENGRWAPNPIGERFRPYEIPLGWHEQLLAHAAACGITLLSTPDDIPTTGLLAKLDVPAIKISSQDLTFLPLLHEAGRTGKPIILSTGIGTLAEIEEAVQAIRGAGNEQIVLLQCVTVYPAEFSEMNIRAMRTLGEAFGLPVGLSDHTYDPQAFDACCLGAVAMGACVLEKHMTFDRNRPGPDHSFALQPEELRQLVHRVRRLEAALGDGRKLPKPRELERRQRVRKSIHAAADIPAGKQLDSTDLLIVRPGAGIMPRELTSVVGSRTRRSIRRYEPITWDLLERGTA